jgi:hypothetical protein
MVARYAIVHRDIDLIAVVGMDAVQAPVVVVAGGIALHAVEVEERVGPRHGVGGEVAFPRTDLPDGLGVSQTSAFVDEDRFGEALGADVDHVDQEPVRSGPRPGEPDGSNGHPSPFPGGGE